MASMMWLVCVLIGFFFVTPALLLFLVLMLKIKSQITAITLHPNNLEGI